MLFAEHFTCKIAFYLINIFERSDICVYDPLHVRLSL